LGDLQDKLAELNQRRAALEDPILEAMLALEDCKKVIDGLEAELEHAMTEHMHTSTDLTKEQDGLTSQLKSVDSEATQVRAQILPANLALYDKLRRKPGGNAVTLIRGTGCGVCGVDLTSQIIQSVRHDEIIPCPTCGRILYI
jgi:predicted  nucleic acid-binding Zn-ribbon protein